MAAGRPKPIVPRPLLERNVRGLVNLKYWAAHIWCWPTPTVMTGSQVVRELPQLADRVLRQDAGEAFVVVERFVSSSTCCIARPRRRCRPAARRSCSARRARYFTSLQTGMWAGLFLLISEASMSMWTILPCLANSSTLPVTRSSKRTPSASSRSACSTA